MYLPSNQLNSFVFLDGRPFGLEPLKAVRPKPENFPHP